MLKIPGRRFLKEEVKKLMSKSQEKTKKLRR